MTLFTPIDASPAPSRSTPSGRARLRGQTVTLDIYDTR